ncbi:MAG: WYL domain-containing transcriptional regulator [Deltaproteobacteria bacterium]|nr:WYL domain-containing transcriptional regulator [Deltaproteobacteria bacterium]
MPPKADPDATSGQKLLMLHSLLQFSNREFSLTELSERLTCSKQTVLRLLDQLETAPGGGLIRETRAGRAYYRMRRPVKRPALALSPEGLEQLALCRDFVLNILPAQMRSTLEEALLKAGSLLPEGEDPVAALAPQAAILTRGAIDYTPFQPLLDGLLAALRHKTVLSLRFRNRLDEERACKFAPVRLLRFHDSLYVEGWMVTDAGRTERAYDRPTTLAVQRLIEATPTRRSFASLELPPLQEDGDFGFDAEEPFAATVRFAPGAASVYVRERIWSRDQKMESDEAGRLVLRFTARNMHELRSWVLSFGPQAEALAPERLREEVASAAAEAAAQYGG